MSAHLRMAVRGFGTIAALVAVVAIGAAWAETAAAEPVPGSATPSSGLIKPVIPPDEGETAPQAPPSLSAPVVGGAARLQRGGDLGQRAWEDEKVKRAALNVAKAVPNVRKIQICYALEEDEWWVSLYDDIGVAVDVKQFVWNRDLEILEPFLVQKRIPRSLLDEHLSRKTPDRACEVVDSDTAANAGR